MIAVLRGFLKGVGDRIDLLDERAAAGDPPRDGAGIIAYEKMYHGDRYHCSFVRPAGAADGPLGADRCRAPEPRWPSTSRGPLRLGERTCRRLATVDSEETQVEVTGVSDGEWILDRFRQRDAEQGAGGVRLHRSESAKDSGHTTAVIAFSR